MRTFRAFPVFVCTAVLFVGCVTQPPALQTPPQLSHSDEVAAFESIVRYKLARLPFPRGSKVYLDAREIFPSNHHIGAAPVEELSRRISTHKIVLIRDEAYPT